MTREGTVTWGGSMTASACESASGTPVSLSNCDYGRGSPSRRVTEAADCPVLCARDLLFVSSYLLEEVVACRHGVMATAAA